jgi:tetratricopeptide (TPR) repeat protein
MSSRHLLVLTALTSLFLSGLAEGVGQGQGAAGQASRQETLADLLLKDEIQKVETRLAGLPRTAETLAFQGEVEYRKGRFDRADSLYRAALQMNEKTARAHFGLGKLAMARMKSADAVKSFNRAIELDGREPIYRFYIADALSLEKKAKEAERHLQEYLKLNPADADRVPMAKAALDISAAFNGVEMGEIEAPAQPAPIRVQQMPLLPFLFAEVTINGQGPFRFLIDTGATQSVLSQKVATRLGLKRIATNIMFGVGGDGKVESPIYKADSVKIGDVTVKNIPLGTLDNPLLDLVMDGILGPTLLADFIITMDYPRNQIQLSRKAPEGGTVVPAWFFGGLLMVPVEVNGKHKGNFLIDSGADSTLLAYTMANSLGVNKDTPGAAVDLPIGGIGGLDASVLMVPSVTLKTPFETKQFDRVMAIELKAMSSLIQTELSGVIGYDTLKNYRVTLDYQRAEIRLTK